jgi:cobalt-zinc-cadmium efflux system outer membrane protein
MMTRFAASASVALACVLFADPARGQTTAEPVRITLDEAIQQALRHNRNLMATRTTIEQSRAQEVTAGLRPNPELSGLWQPAPLNKPSEGSSQYGLGLSYDFELGKRGRRIRAAKDATDVTRSQVGDSERGLAFQVASQFINAQLAESTLELAGQNLKSFQDAVGISEHQYKAGAISENDYLKVKLQLLQFETDVQQAQLARIQALADLRQSLGYESIPADYDVSAGFDYQPLYADLEDLQKLASQNRPDLCAAEKGLAAADSQLELAKVNARPDVTLSANYLYSVGLHTGILGVSIPLPVFDRNQGEVARTQSARTQAQHQHAEVLGQVKTDVKDAYEALQTSDRVARYYQSGYLDVAQKSRDISEYAYRRGAASLLDFLDAERSYRATQIAYRQAIATHLLALEQVRQAVGTRSLQ